MVFEQSLWGCVTNVCKMRCENFWLQNELILVGFWLIQVWSLALVLCLGSKICEKVKSWFLSNLGGELSQMHSK